MKYFEENEETTKEVKKAVQKMLQSVPEFNEALATNSLMQAYKIWCENTPMIRNGFEAPHHKWQFLYLIDALEDYNYGIEKCANYAISNGYLHGSPIVDVTIPDSVTSIVSVAFGDCPFLTSVTIPEGVTEIGGQAFEFCKKLTSVNIPSSVAIIGPGAFYGCYRLPTINIAEGVKEIDTCAFCCCRGLTNLTIPSSVVTIEHRAFDECPNLKLRIPKHLRTRGCYAHWGIKKDQVEWY